MSALAIKLHEALKEYGDFPTLPVGIKMVRTDEKGPQKARILCATSATAWRSIGTLLTI